MTLRFHAAAASTSRADGPSFEDSGPWSAFEYTTCEPAPFGRCPDWLFVPRQVRARVNNASSSWAKCRLRIASSP